MGKRVCIRRPCTGRLPFHVSGSQQCGTRQRIFWKLHLLEKDHLSGERFGIRFYLI